MQNPKKTTGRHYLMTEGALKAVHAIVAFVPSREAKVAEDVLQNVDRTGAWPWLSLVARLDGSAEMCQPGQAQVDWLDLFLPCWERSELAVPRFTPVVAARWLKRRESDPPADIDAEAQERQLRLIQEARDIAFRPEPLGPATDAPLRAPGGPFAFDRSPGVLVLGSDCRLLVQRITARAQAQLDRAGCRVEIVPSTTIFDDGCPDGGLRVWFPASSVYCHGEGPFSCACVILPNGTALEAWAELPDDPLTLQLLDEPKQSLRLDKQGAGPAEP